MTNSYIDVPLKYIWTDYSIKLLSKTKVLKITNENLHFECFSNSDNLCYSKAFQIDFLDILQFRYAEKICLLYVRLKDSPYFNLFGKTPDNILFERTIWFCLDCKDLYDYNAHLAILTNFKVLKLRFNPMLQESLDLFVENVLKAKGSSNFVHWDKLPNFEIEIDESKNVISKELSTNIVKRQNKLRDDEAQKKTKKAKIVEKKYEYCPSADHSIEITSKDLICVLNRKYVNDNIINLYLMYDYYNIMTEDQRQKTHLFSSFFNTKLVGDSVQKKTDTAETRHKRVAKWTKNVDIFEKDFLIIPVCENNHWFVVIVCFPWMVGMVTYVRAADSEEPSPVIDNDSEFANLVREEKVSLIKNEQNVDPKPCILVFDSLASYTRPEKVNIVREYLQSEWNAKRFSKDGPLVFDKSTIRGYLPMLPQQENTKDCGIYLLHYVESFFKSPISNYSYKFFKTHLAPWFEPDDADRKRKEIYETIMKITKEVQ